MLEGPSRSHAAHTTKHIRPQQDGTTALQAAAADGAHSSMRWLPAALCAGHTWPQRAVLPGWMMTSVEGLVQEGRVPAQFYNRKHTRDLAAGASLPAWNARCARWDDPERLRAAMLCRGVVGVQADPCNSQACAGRCSELEQVGWRESMCDQKG